MRRMPAVCCTRAADGHAADRPTDSVMKRAVSLDHLARKREQRRRIRG